MPAQAVQPLRIQKSTPTSSPTKMNGASAQRPLSEINPMERRRNSPSFNQISKKPLFSGESSPFDSSPFNPSAQNSPRLFWQGRGPSPKRENEQTGGRDSSPSPTRRSSIENLKRASRVKNSNMFAREQQLEYDPASVPFLERPLASGRPLSTQVQGNAYSGRGIDGLREETSSPFRAHRRTDTETKVPILTPTKVQTGEAHKTPSLGSPRKDQVSPTKSSLSKNGRFTANPPKYDPESGTWSEEESSAERQLPPGRVLHRHAKSVTFDAAPPQINEYEMTTPDPSSVASGSRDGSYDSGEEDLSFEHDVSHEDSFDASLEDTEKTPVVGPEEWRRLSLGMSHATFSGELEDPFVGERNSPMPGAEPKVADNGRVTPRNDSGGSSGERRPLPPLPGLMGSLTQPTGSSPSGSTVTREQHSTPERKLPSPRPVSITETDLKGIESDRMSLEDRMRLMMIQDGGSSPESQRERRMRRAGAREKSQERDLDGAQGIKIHEDEEDKDQIPDMDEHMLPPRISRESILRKVKDQRQYHDDVDEYYTSPTPSSSPDRKSTFDLDPDTPLPSRELDIAVEDMDTSVVIKREQDTEESRLDLYSVPALYPSEQELGMLQYDEEDSVIHHDLSKDDDDESHYSQPSAAEETYEVQAKADSNDDGIQTPRQGSPVSRQTGEVADEGKDLSLPQFASILGEDDFGLSLSSYMSPPPESTQETTMTGSAPNMASMRDYLQRPHTPEELPDEPKDLEESNRERESGTPDSVLRHNARFEPPPPEDSPSVPEPVATIKAPGGRLKTRPSVTPADMTAMAAARRQVSGEVPDVPPIPARHKDRPPLTLPEETDSMLITESTVNELTEIENGVALTKTEMKRRQSLVKLDMPVDDHVGDLSIGLDQEFDRLIEAQKVAFELSLSQAGYYGHSFDSKDPLANRYLRRQRGYLMRQNTKVIVASSNNEEGAPSTVDTHDRSVRDTRSAGNSPRKASHDRTKSWTTEPWNGKMRRKSIKDAGSPRKKPVTGPVPPLPGKESNVHIGLDSVAENEVTTDIADDGEGRGRLFVKVVGIKDMDLPLPKGERTWFCLTLDNGLHCVTTSWLELGRNAPIGQEFELIVQDDLEFMLTLNTKLEKPAPRAVESPTKSVKPQTRSAFSRVFASPRKRKELEKQQEDDRRTSRQQQDAQARRINAEPTAWDLMHTLVATDGKEKGSFARSYVCLKDHENRCFGRPYTVDITCFNEWATEEVSSVGGSSKNKRGGSVVQRRAPYRIGKLELQLLFVPRPKGATDADMPKSMNSCIREMREAEASATRTWEGCLSQQGGDCPFWRRRFFKLDGSKLTAYHESTRQPRATINLAKASKLIDDRSSLVNQSGTSPTKSKGRRKSAFAEEEEGYMFVEEGFRIRFANGEVIDFYADSAADKDGWMKVLSECVGKESTGRGWTEMVLKREAMQGGNAITQGDRKDLSPKKKRREQSFPSQPVTQPLPPLAKDPAGSMGSPIKERRGRMGGAQPKSMIF